MIMDDELLNDFLEESFDLLKNIQEALVPGYLTSLDTNAKQEVVNSLYRWLHTIKGGSSMFSLTQVTEIAHKLESEFDGYKAKPELLDNKAVDVIREKVKTIEALLRGDALEEAVNEETTSEVQSPPNDLTSIHFNHLFQDSDFKLITDYYVGQNFPIFETIIPESQTQIIIDSFAKFNIDKLSENKLDQKTTALLFAYEKNDHSKEQTEILNKLFSKLKVNRIFPKAVETIQVDTQEKESTVRPAKSKKELLRVPTEKINSVLESTWELLLLRNKISYTVSKNKYQMPQSFIQEYEALDLQLQRTIQILESKSLSMRMSSLESTFSRMEMVVDDYKKKTKKEINFILEGNQVELDKKVIDMIAEPLIHLIRNAMDHGIEDSEGRVKAGKDLVGKIYLKASSNGENATIEVIDDGKGIDAKRIFESAKKKGLPVDHIKTPKEMVDLIFYPGFSTAEAVSEVSGRGVGMDAVKSSIQSIGGEVSIKTEIGKGSTFKITFPLGISTFSALIVKVNDYPYVFNTNNLIKTQKISIFDLVHNDGGQFVKYNGHFIPCYNLSDFFVKTKIDHQVFTECSICIFQISGGLIAYRFDEIDQYISLVAKPVPPLAKKHPFVSGVSLLESGTPVFILNVEALAKHFKETYESREALKNEKCA